MGQAVKPAPDVCSPPPTRAKDGSGHAESVGESCPPTDDNSDDNADDMNDCHAHSY
ncbi:hypothetical protein FMUBM48_03660 [Nocardia cyriacigeorgica]|nr:hypothetical protein FMUBM48_03660 [Nocardia cyriacigeorgica]